MSEVIVIGGGAAGMMAAIAAASSGHCVSLLEKNEKLGKKLYITGKGRCNVTNACDFEHFQEHIVHGGSFLNSSLRGFGNTDLRNFLEEAGCPLKTERGDRVFPKSDHASDVTKVLSASLERLGVRTFLKTEARKIRAGSGFQVLTGAGGDEFTADAVIICTGGLSYPSTGSTGDGYRFASDFAIALSDRHPSLVPLCVEEKEDCSRMQGLSLKNVNLLIRETDDAGDIRGKTVYEGFGELLITHFGLSGPLALSASAYLGEGLAQGKHYRAFLDLKPALSPEKLDERILRDFSAVPNRSLLNALCGLLPQSMRSPVLSRAGLSEDCVVHDLTKAGRKRLLSTIKAYPLTISGTRGFSEAVITQGGIRLSELNPRSMESKRVPGLYFAGEVLDIDALTGGFNLQLAFSTGYAAGSHIPLM